MKQYAVPMCKMSMVPGNVFAKLVLMFCLKTQCQCTDVENAKICFVVMTATPIIIWKALTSSVVGGNERCAPTNISCLIEVHSARPMCERLDEGVGEWGDLEMNMSIFVNTATVHFVEKHTRHGIDAMSVLNTK